MTDDPFVGAIILYSPTFYSKRPSRESLPVTPILANHLADVRSSRLEKEAKIELLFGGGGLELVYPSWDGPKQHQSR